MTQYPPPGAQDSTPPEPPPHSWPAPGAPPTGPVPGAPWTAGQPPPAGPQWAPAGAPPWGPPVHQPGVVPLRPLTLGDIFGGAIQTVRRNPKATIGLAAVVTFLFMLVPMIVTVVLGTGGDLSLDTTPDGSSSSSGAMTSDVGLLGSSVLTGVFSALSSIVVTGLIVRIVEQALMGQKLSGGEAWRRSRGRLLPLLGFTLLVAIGLLLTFGVPTGIGVAIGLVASNTPLAVGLGILGGIAGLVLTVFLYTRYVLLGSPVLVLEGLGVFATFKRSGQLARGQFWRLLGIYLLAALVTGLVGQVIAIPFAILGVLSIFVLPEGWELAGMLLTSNISTVLTGALVGPFSAGVMALQYYDQRFRKEGLDIQLLQQSLQSGPR
jgi:hypothetical protein